MIIEYAAKVDIGRNTANDDRLLVHDLVLDSGTSYGSVEAPNAIAVCDGCGGYIGGGYAAELVLKTLASENKTDLLNEDSLRKSIDKCQNKLIDKQKELPEYSQMCTTIAGCIIGEDRTVIFHSGDSRVYRLNKWGIAQMTLDHSFVQQLISAGKISDDEAKIHPRRNVINRCLGIDKYSPDIYIVNKPFDFGEKYIVCTDGLWEYIDDRDFESVLTNGTSLRDMTDKLVETALRNGCDDNLSVCICSALN